MEGFRRFVDRAAFRIPPSPVPETPTQCVPGSSSSLNHPINGESFFDDDQTLGGLRAAFSRLKVSSFSRQPPPASFDGGYRINNNDGSFPKYPLSTDHGFLRENNSMPFYGGDGGGNGVIWDMGLEDCWVSDNTNRSMAEFRGKIVPLARDQHGCRFLQREMAAFPANKELIDLVFTELIENVAPLMADQYGTHVVQKFVEVCNEEQRTLLLLKLTEKNAVQFVCIALDTRGARCVQKLLKYVTTNRQISIFMGALSPYAAAMSKNSNGVHVIRHCLENFSVEDNRDLLHVVTNNCFGIAKDKNGCCVLQKCVEHSNGEIRERLVAAIIDEAILLAVDRYGNYVVQHLLGLKIPQITENLLGQLAGGYFRLSSDKYGSNVVEKCLLESGEEQSSQIIFELLMDRDVSTLLWHPFGNYVIQRALSVSKGIYHQALLNLVRLHSHIMRGNPFGQKVLAWCERRSSQHI